MRLPPSAPPTRSGQRRGSRTDPPSSRRTPRLSRPPGATPPADPRGRTARCARVVERWTPSLQVRREQRCCLRTPGEVDDDRPCSPLDAGCHAPLRRVQAEDAVACHAREQAIGAARARLSTVPIGSKRQVAPPSCETCTPSGEPTASSPWPPPMLRAVTADAARPATGDQVRPLVARGERARRIRACQHQLIRSCQALHANRSARQLDFAPRPSGVAAAVHAGGRARETDAGWRRGQTQHGRIEQARIGAGPGGAVVLRAQQAVGVRSPPAARSRSRARHRVSRRDTPRVASVRTSLHDRPQVARTREAALPTDKQTARQTEQSHSAAVRIAQRSGSTTLPRHPLERCTAAVVSASTPTSPTKSRVDTRAARSFRDQFPAVDSRAAPHDRVRTDRRRRGADAGLDSRRDDRVRVDQRRLQVWRITSKP